MKLHRTIPQLFLAAVMLWSAPLSAESREQAKRKCEQSLVTAADRYVSCLLRARSARSAKSSSEVLEKKLSRCEGIYRPHFEAIVQRFGERACTDAKADILANYIEYATFQIHSASSPGDRGEIASAWKGEGTASNLLESTPSLALWVDYPNQEVSMDEYKTYLISLSSFLKENPAITEVVLRIEDPSLHVAFERYNFNDALKDYPAEVRLQALPETDGPSTLGKTPEPAIGPVKYVSGSAFNPTP